MSLVLIEQDEDWYIAYCPEIPGANGQGRTVEECRVSLGEAIKLIREDAVGCVRVKLCMGEVRVKIKLINASDERLVRLGQLTKDKVRAYETDALVDTGAVSSVLPIEVVQRMGLF